MAVRMPPSLSMQTLEKPGIGIAMLQTGIG